MPTTAAISLSRRAGRGRERVDDNQENHAATTISPARGCIAERLNTKKSQSCATLCTAIFLRPLPRSLRGVDRVGEKKKRKQGPVPHNVSGQIPRITPGSELSWGGGGRQDGTTDEKEKQHDDNTVVPCRNICGQITHRSPLGSVPGRGGGRHGEKDACYHRGAPLFFWVFLSLGAQDLPKTDFEQN